MPRDINGVYTPPAGTIVASGDTILPSQHNPSVNDVAAALTYSLSRQGQGSMLADLSFGGFKAKDLAAATLAGDAPRYDQTNGATISTGLGVSGGNAIVEVGGLRTGNGVAALDLHATSGSDYEARFLRYTGTNGAVDLRNTGTGAMNFVQEGLGAFTFYTNGILRAQMSSGGTLSLLTSNLDLVSNGIVWSTVLNAAVGLSSGNLTFQGDTGDLYEIDRAGNFHRWLIGATEIARLTAAGRLGIGTTAPMAKLQVVGGGTVDGQAGTAAIIGAGGGADLFLGSTGGAPFVASQGTASLNLGVNGSNKVSVDNSGNLNLLSLSNFYLGSSGGNARLNGDLNDYYEYDRTNNQHVWAVGSVVRFNIDATYGPTIGAVPSYGAQVGYLDMPFVDVIPSRDLALTDRGCTISIPLGVNIPTNATVPFPMGTTIDVVNTGGIPASITASGSVTLIWCPSGSTGTRTLSNTAYATLKKVGLNIWYITGAGIS